MKNSSPFISISIGNHMLFGPVQTPAVTPSLFARMMKCSVWGGCTMIGMCRRTSHSCHKAHACTHDVATHSGIISMFHMLTTAVCAVLQLCYIVWGLVAFRDILEINKIKGGGGGSRPSNPPIGQGYLVPRSSAQCHCLYICGSVVQNQGGLLSWQQVLLGPHPSPYHRGYRCDWVPRSMQDCTIERIWNQPTNLPWGVCPTNAVSLVL